MTLSYVVTRRKLQLGNRDSTTGWYTKSYVESSQEMIVIPRGATSLAVKAGVYVRLDAVGLAADVFVEGDEIETLDNVFYEVKTVKPYYFGDSFMYRECDLARLPLKSLTGGSYTASSVEDARYRTKVYLETYLSSSALPSYIVAYGTPDYPMTHVFKTKGIDLVFSLGEPNSTPLIQHNQTPYGYEEHVPITPCCIDKTNITGTKLLQQARTELRRISETYPFGSLRHPVREEPETEILGSTILYKYTFWLDYKRDTS